MEWELDLATAWAKVELMTTTAHTVTLGGSLSDRRVLLALPGELYCFFSPVSVSVRSLSIHAHNRSCNFYYSTVNFASEVSLNTTNSIICVKNLQVEPLSSLQKF